MRRSLLNITNKRNTKFKIRRSILLAILTLIFVAFGGSSVSALDLSQESIEITDKSATTVVHNAGIGDLRITPNLEFNRLDDFISYKLVIKNNDGKKYRIVSITDDNSNEAIALTYSYPTEMDIKNKEIDFTVKYVKITNSPLKTINVVIKIVDEEDASEEIPIVIPNTGANTSFDTVSAVTVQSIIIYIVFAAICCAIYIIVRRKKMEKDKRVDLRVPKALLGFALLLGIIPVAVIAASFESIYFTVNLTEVKLNGPYVITFDTDEGGTSIPDQIVNNGDPIAKPSPDPERKGYTFEGWVDENGDPYDFDTPVSGPVKISADWKPITYTIAYDLAGGIAGAPANKTEYTIETPDFTLTNPTKEHYDFAGWTGTDLSGPTTTVKISQGSTENRSYTATWKEKEYTATFDTDGGIPAIANQTKKYNETFTKPADPEKLGYAFKGWFLDDTAYDFATKVTRNITLKAKWEKKEYTVTFDTKGGSPIPVAQTIKYQETATKPEDPTMTGHNFKGWQLNGADYNFATKVTDNITLVAKWEKKEYTVTFDANGGTPTPAAQTVKYQETATKPEDPTMTGHNFKGWFLGDATEAYNFATEVTDNITLVAKWEKKEYTVTFDANGGTPTPAAQTVKYQETATRPENPTKDDYRFFRWLDENGNEYDFATPVTKNITLTAEWTQLFVVSFNTDGGSLVPAQQIANGGLATRPSENPTKTGYNFIKWVDESNNEYKFNTPVTADITLVANWEIIEYTISYEGLEGAMVNPANTATYTIKSDAITLNDAMKPGYTFDGWTGEGITTPTKGITIPSGSTGDRIYTANWTIITYNINYAGLEDATVNPANKTTYDVKTETFTLTEPTKRGYTFTGWTSSSDGITTPTKSITIAEGSTGDRDYTANWVLTVFTIAYDLDGGDVATANPTEYTMVTETFEISNEPTKDGTYAMGMDKYEFIGWTGTELSGPTKPVTIVKGSVGDRSYKANYKHSFKVLFNPGDHGMVTELDRWVEENTAVGAFPTVTVDPGYRFVGWYNSLDSTQTIVDETYKVTTVVGFTAKYEVIDYTISLNPNGGTYKGSTSTYTADTYNIESPSPVTVWEPSATDLGPTQEGYRFTGWTGEGITTPTLSKIELAVTAETLGNKTYTANWVKQWTVTFKSEGSVVTTEKVDDGAAVTRPADPIKTNYVLRAWQLGGVDYDFSTPVTGDITLVADWQVARSTLNFDGPTMGTKMKQLINPSVTNGYTTSDTQTKAFARATEDDYNAAVQAGLTIEVVSTDSSIVDTFMWFDSTTGTINYYTEAAKVYVSGSMEKMFARFDNLTDLSGLKDFDVSGVTDMNRLFQNCKSLNDTSLASLVDWDTTNVINMTFIFGASESTYKNQITKLDSLSKWNVSNVRSFYQAFKECTELTDISGIKDWDVSSVGYYDDSGFTNASDNFGFQQMFNKCSKLADALAISGWDINYAVTSFYEAGLAGKKIGSTTLSKNSGFVNILGNNTVIVNKPNFSEYAPGGSWNGGSYVPNTPPATP